MFKKATEEKAINVTLPHDAMILEERTPTTKNGSTTGFYPGGTYYYTKELFIPEEWKDRVVVLEFEGVYAHAFVYVNNVFAVNWYMVIPILCRLYRFVKVWRNQHYYCSSQTGMEQTSRWYTGSGIYRDV